MTLILDFFFDFLLDLDSIAFNGYLSSALRPGSTSYS